MKVFDRIAKNDNYILGKYIDEQEVYIVKYKIFIQYGLRPEAEVHIV